MPLPNTGMSFTPFDPLPASELNDLVENIEALADGTGPDDELSWSPTLSGRFDNAKWDKSGTYRIVGDTVFAQVLLTANAGTPMSGSGHSIFSLPVASVNYGTSNVPILGVASFIDTGTALLTGACQWIDTTTANCQVILASGSYAQPATTTNTIPFTWVSGDQIYINIRYRAA